MSLRSVLVAVACTLCACGAPVDEAEQSLPPPPIPSTSTTEDSVVGDHVRPIAIDTDLGADDLLAITAILARPDWSVISITVAGSGLVHCEAGPAIVARVVALAGLAPIPIGCGATEPGPDGMVFPDDWRAAADGVSGVDDLLPPAIPDEPRSAVAVLTDAVTTSPEPVTVLALGPLTTLAHVSELGVVAPEQIARVYVMGGILDGPAADGIGEWNAAVDPAAMTAVLASGWPVSVVPSDAAPLGSVEVPTADARDGSMGALAAGIVARNEANLPAWWDLYAALVAIDPSVATATIEGAFSVEAGGAESGRLVRRASGPTVTVVREISAASAASVLTSSLLSPP